MIKVNPHSIVHWYAKEQSDLFRTSQLVSDRAGTRPKLLLPVYNLYILPHFKYVENSWSFLIMNIIQLMANISMNIHLVLLGIVYGDIQIAYMMIF